MPERKMKMSVTTTVAASAWLARSAAKRIAPAALVPPVLRSNEELMAEARVYCDEHTTWTALPTCHIDDLFGLTAECQDLESDVAERIGQWHRDRGPVAAQLRLVSKDWRRAREKPTNILKAELARLKQHKDMLDNASSRVLEEIDRRDDD